MTTHVVKEGDFLINNFSNNDCLLCVHGKEGEEGEGVGGAYRVLMVLVLQSCQQGFYTCTNYMCSHLFRKFKKKNKKNQQPHYISCLLHD